MPIQVGVGPFGMMVVHQHPLARNEVNASQPVLHAALSSHQQLYWAQSTEHQIFRAKINAVTSASAAALVGDRWSRGPHAHQYGWKLVQNLGIQGAQTVYHLGLRGHSTP